MRQVINHVVGIRHRHKYLVSWRIGVLYHYVPRLCCGYVLPVCPAPDLSYNNNTVATATAGCLTLLEIFWNNFFLLEILEIYWKLAKGLSISDKCPLLSCCLGKQDQCDPGG